MATQIKTTQRIAYFDADPDEAREQFRLAWAHGECIMRIEEIPAVPFARVVRGEYAGQSGRLNGMVYDLTGERYDRWYYALIEGVNYSTMPEYQAFVPVDDIEIEEVAAARER